MKSVVAENAIGEVPTEEEIFYVAWGREGLKSEMEGVGDSLKQLVTLSSAMAGGALVLNHGAIKHPFDIIAILCFIFCLGISFCGTMPYAGNVDLQKPYAIKSFREKAVSWKHGILKIAAFFLFVGFLIAGAGLLAGIKPQ